MNINDLTKLTGKPVDELEKEFKENDIIDLNLNER